MSDRILMLVLAILGTLAVLCIGGIILLSYAVPARSIPDVLVATTGSVVTGFVALLPSALAGRASRARA